MSYAILNKVQDYSSSPAEFTLRGLLGAALSADWRQAMIARGFGYHVDVGAFSTPIQGGGAGTILDLDQPEFGISVATGYTIVPIRVDIAVQVPISAADSDENEILLAVDRAAAWAGDGTVTTETAVNMRTNATGNPSGVTIFSAATADITDPVLGHELAHRVKIVDYVGTPANALMSDLQLLYEPLNPPFLVGPCCLYGYWGGTVANTGFANIDFIAFASSLITGLS
jgi:hypothetical protein